MTFAEALRAAGIQNPGRTTRHGQAEDGTPVFTIWADDVHVVDGRSFAWWDHCGEAVGHAEPPLRKKAAARAFVRRAEASVGRYCRIVIVHPKSPKPDRREVARAEYPHPKWARATVRFADSQALHFLFELLPASKQ